MIGLLNLESGSAIIYFNRARDLLMKAHELDPTNPHYEAMLVRGTKVPAPSRCRAHLLQADQMQQEFNEKVLSDESEGDRALASAARDAAAALSITAATGRHVQPPPPPVRITLSKGWYDFIGWGLFLGGLYILSAIASRKGH
jgi:hypothetical protein